MTIAVLPQPYLLFLGDSTEPAFAKTALGLVDWAPERCVGELQLPGATVSTGLPAMSPQQAQRHGARALVIGVAAVGGAVMPHWLPVLVEAMEAGLDLIGGMHTRLNAIPELVAAASRTGQRMYDVRNPPAGLAVATGRRRSGMRLLTVGTDCALGKKYTALALTRAMRARGIAAEFRATGQTGIIIAGAGIPIDAVVADFAAGAAEALSPDNDAAHWDIIEGQGSLFHPSYAGVSLALLHGSQPDVLVLCHEAGRQHLAGLPQFALPALDEAIALHLALGRRVNPGMRCAAISLNTSRLGDTAARAAIAQVQDDLGLPCFDPLRDQDGLERAVDACLEPAPALA